MTKLRVIHMLNHSPWFFRDQNKPMDEQAMTDDWHFRTAYQLERIFPGRFALECWRPDWREPVEKTVVVKGIPCHIFPSRHPPLGRFNYELSLPMLARLRQEALRGPFVLHVHEVHCLTAMLAAFLGSHVVKVAHNHGNPSIGMRLQEGRPLWKAIPMRMLLPLEEAATRRYDHIFAISDKELAYLRQRTPRVTKLTMGVDFQAFAPREKALARQRLGLPQEAKIALYVGRFFRVKSSDKLLACMEEVRRRLPGAFLLAMGGLPHDELYKEMMAGADMAVLRGIPDDVLPEYYAASDLYVYPAEDPALNGIGMAPVEAMAMNLPVLSSALAEFPGSDDERARLGIVYSPQRDDLAQLMVEGLTGQARFSPRETAADYYDWPIIARGIAEVYDRAWRERHPDWRP